jgi:hypothetical protein
MENVLDLYAGAWDSKHLIVYWDEMLYRLLEHTRQPQPTQVEKPRREGYTYKCNGRCNSLLLFGPQACWCLVKVTVQRKGIDYAECLRDLEKLETSLTPPTGNIKKIG